MSRDIYPALTGASATWQQMNFISNNLSNATTNGYKAKRVAFENHRELPGVLGDSFAMLGKQKTDTTEGTFQQDGVDTHFAIGGKGYFAVEGAGGEVLLMRAGFFQFDRQGFLVNSQGEKVLAEGGGYIRFDRDEPYFNVTRDARILDDAGGERGRFMILDSEDVEPLMGSRYRAAQTQDVVDSVELVQGALEASNANPFREMVEMMQATRYFESFQKAMATSAELDQKLNQSAKRS